MGKHEAPYNLAKAEQEDALVREAGLSRSALLAGATSQEDDELLKVHFDLYTKAQPLREKSVVK